VNFGRFFEKNAPKSFGRNFSEKDEPKRRNFSRSGTDVMILKIFSPKNSAKKLAFFVSKQSQILKKVHHNIGKTPIFSPKIEKNRRKL
jgi:hypothetical protein